MKQHAYSWIDGEWGGAAPGSPRCGACIDPATGEQAATYSDAQESDVTAAIAAARRVFDDGAWARSPRLRARVLLDFADRLAARRAPIEAALTRVNGKLLRESAAEMNGAISELRYYAGLARGVFGRTMETEPGCVSNIVREPLGVVGIIVPWNAPITLLVRSLAPALAAGCAVVVKAAPQTSTATALALKCLEEVPGIPQGTVNLFTESGASGAEVLVGSTDVDGISFTGSNAVGKKIMTNAAGTMKRLSLELGGKCPSLVFSDADVAQAAKTISASAIVMAGQMCTAVARVLVHEAVAVEMRAALKSCLGNVRVGPGSDPASGMGPLIDRASRDRVAEIVAHAADEGTVHLHGQVPTEYPGGAFLTPSLVEVRDLGSRSIQEEVFGPLLVFETFGHEEEAIARANATRYGLAASIWSADRGLAERVSRRLAAGTVWINSHNRLMAEAETGGYRESGIGRLHGLEGLDNFLHSKHIYYEY